MKWSHFRAFRPVCPVCRPASPSAPFALQVAAVAEEDELGIQQGVLQCSNPHCWREYPILDGIPLLIPQLREYITENVFHLVLRNDLSEANESILGDCCGPGTWFDLTRQHLSSYTWDHYAEFDPQERHQTPAPGSLGRLLSCCWPWLEPLPPGPLLDVGCSVGALTWKLAERTTEFLLGIDLNFAMLRLAQSILRTGQVRYSRRRVGVVYDRHEFPVPTPGAERVDFWACNVEALPFASDTFSAAVAMNVLDSVRSPVDLLRSINVALQPGGKLLLSCPFDWSAAVTPIESWLGGHSQRNPQGGASAPMLEALLTPGSHPWSLPDMRITHRSEEFPWTVRMQERSVIQYQPLVLAAEKLTP